MGRDEQQEELEILRSIYPDEIQDVSDTEYRITIALDVPEDEDEDGVLPSIILRVRYPEDYPEVAPELDIGAAPNAPKYKDLDVQEDKTTLLESLTASVEENIGMAMVFTLVTTLKDSAELLIMERRQATQALKNIELAKAEEEENRKFHGTAVTRESFLEWRNKFRQGIEDVERRQQEEKELEEKKKRVVKEEKKLTGKELWERGLVGKMEEDEDEGEDALADVKSLKITG